MKKTKSFQEVVVNDLIKALGPSTLDSMLTIILEKSLRKTFFKIFIEGKYVISSALDKKGQKREFDKFYYGKKSTNVTPPQPPPDRHYKNGRLLVNNKPKDSYTPEEVRELLYKAWRETPVSASDYHIVNFVEKHVG